MLGLRLVPKLEKNFEVGLDNHVFGILNRTKVLRRSVALVALGPPLDGFVLPQM
jgi:hypothetical protein